jgi:hypothetical protein
MKISLKNSALCLMFLFPPTLILGQTPPSLGAVADFVLFSSVGAVTNLGSSQVTGDFGTNSGAVSGFGNVNGQMHIANALTTQCANDLGIAYTNLSGQIPTVTLGAVLGGGQVLFPNVYLIDGASSLVDILILDGCGDPNACFVFQMNGAFSAAAGSKIILTNGTKACNIFWRVDGQMSMATNTSFKGTLIVAGAIPLEVGVHLEGRALSVSGAISGSDLTASLPLGCGEPVLIGPAAPSLGTVECFAILTSDGTATNTGTTNVIGDIGTDNGTVSGYNHLGVEGVVHSMPDAFTAQASADLNNLYTSLNSQSSDIELVYPLLFGHSQTLTPHTYIMNAAAVLTDTIFLDARGITDAVFIIRIMGSLTTNSNPQVVLLGGLEAKNIFWQVEGAVTIGNSGNFNGIIVANNAAIILNTGAILNGRALSTTGDITTGNVNIIGTNAAATPSSAPTLCINTLLTDITHVTTGATGIGAPTDLPAGVTAAWSVNTITLSGTPTVTGTFNYSIPLTGGCGSTNATGTITVSPVTMTSNSSTCSSASSTPTVCVNTELPNLTHTTTEATGIGCGIGLPPGITADWSLNTITLSGQPEASGTFNYSIPLTGGCGSANATGTINVTAVTPNTASSPPSQTLCLSNPFSYIAHTTAGASGIGSAMGLPDGVTASWSANTIIMSGTPTSPGTFLYSIPLTGGCGCAHAAGIIIVTEDAAPTADITSTSGTTCHGVKYTLSGNITANGAWTLTLNNGQTTSGSGNSSWELVVMPTSTTTYTISSLVDANSCPGILSGSVTLTLPISGTTISKDNESSTCAVNQTGWVHYYHSSGRLIASINSNGQNLGTVSVTSYLDVMNQVIPACDNPSPLYETAVMQRHWVITPSIQPTTPVIVRLPFTNTELTNLSSVANSNVNLWDNVTGITDINLSKYSGPTNIDNNAYNNCISAGGSGGTTTYNQLASGVTTEYSAVTSTQYSDYSIPGFSEFWLHASFTNSPLPIELLSFTADTKNTAVQINWITASENGNSHFNIERSIDGIDFSSIVKINGAGNSSQILNYSALDETPLDGLSYYRLKQTDYEGGTSYSNIESVEFNGMKDFFINLYPNPFLGETTFHTNANLEGSGLIIYNSCGQITNQIENLSERTFTLHCENLSGGLYFITLLQNGKVMATEKLVITD